MVNYDFVGYFIGGNALLYLLIHLPLDLLTLINKHEKRKEEAEDYPAWEEGRTIMKIITVFTSLYFWLFFLGWPILHLLKWDNFILFFNFQIPKVGEALQYMGLILIGAGTLIACIGRIARGVKAISWGVPKELTTNLGFRIVRHPLYASYCYYFLGIPLAMLNFLLLLLIPGIIGYYFTAKYEESILIHEFGEQYEKYQRKVGMFIPFVGRRKD
ncbi:MAG: hypothetical protein GF308_17650 [Candidatus Heimdallarchaeota archaeon]|nr:hypothetical protein [Candidatus Heimdallarchaeota archaeon]